VVVRSTPATGVLAAIVVCVGGEVVVDVPVFVPGFPEPVVEVVLEVPP